MIRIAIVDDHQMVRQGLHQLLNFAGDMLVVGQACDGLQAVDLCAKLTPDVVVMDVAMPNMDGITAGQMICQQNPNIKVVMYSALIDEETRQAAIRAGAQKVLSKNVPTDEILETIRAVCGDV